MNICRNIGTHKYFGYSLKFLSVCWNLKTNKKKKVKKKKSQKRPDREMLKALNSEVRNTE